MFDKPAIRRSFTRAAAQYEQHAWLQREVRSRLYERLDELDVSPALVLDLGCGSGHGTAQLKQRYRGATVIGLDSAWAMCQQCRQQSRWRRSVHSIQADITQLPVAAQQADLMVANLVLQWITDLPAALQSIRRVLKPDGVVLFSTFGPDTLTELRQAWAKVDNQPRVSSFVDQRVIGDLLVSTGFRNPVMDCDRITATYQQVDGLMHDLKAIGAHNAHRERPRGLTGRHTLNAMRQAYEIFRDTDSGLLPATWEVVYATAWGAPEGQPVRTDDGGERAAFSVTALRQDLKKKS